MSNEQLMEEVFGLVYFAGFTYEDAMRMPTTRRRWFLKRTQEELEKNKTKTNIDVHVEVPVDALKEALEKNDDGND